MEEHQQLHTNDEIHTAPHRQHRSWTAAVAGLLIIAILVIGILFLLQDRQIAQDQQTPESTPNFFKEIPDPLGDIESDLMEFAAPDVSL